MSEPSDGYHQCGGEYATRGEYHRNLDPGWSYYPIYVRKLAIIDELVGRLPPAARLLDAGCGEGLLVEKYRAAGRSIVGLDLDFASEWVRRGDILDMPFADHEFDAVLMLDVIEHLAITDQPRALAEAHRVLRPGGRLVIAIPNLAHLASRLVFLTAGRLVRTARVNKHPGDRPIGEYLEILAESGFVVEQHRGVQLTLPARAERWLRRLFGRQRLERFIYSPARSPGLCFLNIVVAAR